MSRSILGDLQEIRKFMLPRGGVVSTLATDVCGSDLFLESKRPARENASEEGCQRDEMEPRKMWQVFAILQIEVSHSMTQKQK